MKYNLLIIKTLYIMVYTNYKDYINLYYHYINYILKMKCNSYSCRLFQMDLQSWRKRFTKVSTRTDEERMGRAVREKSSTRDKDGSSGGHETLKKSEKTVAAGMGAFMFGTVGIQQGSNQQAYRNLCTEKQNKTTIGNVTWHSGDEGSELETGSEISTDIMIDFAVLKGTPEGGMSGESGVKGDARGEANVTMRGEARRDKKEELGMRHSSRNKLSASQAWRKNRPSLKLEVNRREELKQQQIILQQPQICITSPDSPKTTESLTGRKRHKSRYRMQSENTETEEEGCGKEVEGRRRSFVRSLLRRNKSTEPKIRKGLATEKRKSQPSVTPDSIEPTAEKSKTPQVSRKKYGFGRLISKWKSLSDIPANVDRDANTGAGEEESVCWSKAYEDNFNRISDVAASEFSLTPSLTPSSCVVPSSQMPLQMPLRTSIRLPKMLSRRKTITDGTTHSIDLAPGKHCDSEGNGRAEHALDLCRPLPGHRFKFGCSSEDEEYAVCLEPCGAEVFEETELQPAKFSVAEKIKNRLSASMLQDLDKVPHHATRLRPSRYHSNTVLLNKLLMLVIC